MTEQFQVATVRWVGGLFALSVLAQRFAVPGLPVALLLPLFGLGVAWGVLRGLAEFDPYRTAAWLLASAAMAAVIGVQQLLVEDAIISVSSWALFIVTWAPFTLRLVDRRRETFLATLRVVVGITMLLAAVTILMFVTQLIGVPYRDWLAEAVPATLLLQDFVITYPVEYGSNLHRSNAWIGLEPSIVSAQLGVGLVAAVLVQARTATIVFLAAGLVSAFSGSGFAIAIMAVVVMLVLPGRHMLRRYRVAAGVALAAILATPVGQGLFGRVTEVFTPRSSTNLRAVLPYQTLWNIWTDNVALVLLGGGPGSSQELVEQTGILGLLVPTPVKVFFDYGLVAGGMLAGFIIVCYVGGHTRALAVSLFISLWTLQPGTTVLVLLVPLVLLVSWWSPQAAPPMDMTTAGSPLPEATPAREGPVSA